MSREHLPVFTVSDLEGSLLPDLQSFENDDAVDLGLVTVELIRERGLSLAVEIARGDDTVFRAKLARTGPDNDRWLAGKAAAVRMFGVPSLLVKLRHLEAGTPFAERDDIDHEKVKAHGGSVPIPVGGEIVGTLTVSGEPDVVDHEVATAALRRYASGTTRIES